MMRLTKAEKAVVARVLNAMLEAGDDVHRYMLHPRNGQFDSNPSEAARSFVRAFAVKHEITGVDVPDPSWYREDPEDAVAS